MKKSVFSNTGNQEEERPHRRTGQQTSDVSSEDDDLARVEIKICGNGEFHQWLHLGVEKGRNNALLFADFLCSPEKRRRKSFAVVVVKKWCGGKDRKQM